MLPAPHNMATLIRPFTRVGEIDIRHTKNLRVPTEAGMNGSSSVDRTVKTHLDPEERARLVKAGRHRKAYLHGRGLQPETTHNALLQAREVTDAGATASWL